MKIASYGEKGRKVVLILHGGGLGPWSVETLSESLGEVYHVRVPYLPGHAGSDAHFTSIEDTAEELIHMIDGNMGGEVFLLMGLSLGADIALEMLSRRSGIAEHAIIESANVIPTRMPRFLLRASIRMSFPLTRKRGFAKAQFRELRLPDEMFEDYFRDTSTIEEEDLERFTIAALTYRLGDGIRKTEADVHVVCGERETGSIRNSANLINMAIPSSTLTVIPELSHGEASIRMHPEFMDIILDLN